MKWVRRESDGALMRGLRGQCGHRCVGCTGRWAGSDARTLLRKVVARTRACLPDKGPALA
eukprot:15447182-Alexandrium_andersonii.AAC.1